MPTASAVVADMIDTAVGRTDITFRTLALWSDRGSPVVMKPFEKLTSRYYLRLRVSDQPGVLAEITGILAEIKFRLPVLFSMKLNHWTPNELLLW